MRLFNVFLSIWIIVFMLGCVLLVIQRKRVNETPIYCLMVTGKGDNRIRFAKQSVLNFQRQSFANKYLIIINEGTEKVLDTNSSSMFEIQVRNVSLGKMRNISLEFVPPNAIWTTWDDDDWRSDDYLRILYDELKRHPTKKYLMFCNRIDHNMQTNFSYHVQLLSGTYIFFAFKDPMIQYADLPTKEDAVVKQYMIRNGDKTHLFVNNDPRIYVRFIHGSNTSTYVHKNKRAITNYASTSTYREHPLSDEQQKYVIEVKQYFA